MVNPGKALLNWLATHWVSPAYAGGVLLGLTIAFFGAAVNSMSGWLYALSGGMLAIVLVSIWAPPRSFKGLQIHRTPTAPVSVGEPLAVKLVLENLSAQPKLLLQVRDPVPSPLGMMPEQSIAAIAPHQSYTWTYTCRPTQRGIYRWDTLILRTAAPLGLFWSQRSQRAPAQATVYPEILPLSHCPLIDQMGVDVGLRWQTARQSQQANEGLTRAVRPYRWGDPTRLIHWRTSARYGELRVRELEEVTADNQVLLGLDTGDRWLPADFEAAVVAIASLYVYSLRRQLSVAVWLPHTGLLQNQRTVLTALAEVMPGPTTSRQRLPGQPLIWLNGGGALPPALPMGSQWVSCASVRDRAGATTPVRPMLALDPAQPLLVQLQAEL